jgi:hypothetical protein
MRAIGLIQTPLVGLRFALALGCNAAGTAVDGGAINAPSDAVRISGSAAPSNASSAGDAAR